MDNMTLEKMKYLIKGLTGQDISTELIESASDKKINMEDFQKMCEEQAGIAIPIDPLEEKYKDIELYSEKTFKQKVREIFPQKMEVNFPDIDAASLKHYMKTQMLKNDVYYPAYVNTPQDHSEKLDVRLELNPKEYGKIWPDTTRYQDIEMDLWLMKKYPEKNASNLYRSLRSNFVKQHPDLTGGLLMFSWPDEWLHNKLTVEGRPFHEAMRIVIQDPTISTARLKELLANPQERQRFMEGDPKTAQRESANLVMSDDYLHIYQYGVNGYASVNRSRKLVQYGEPFSEKCQKFIANMVENKQLLRGTDRLFFNDFWNNRPEPDKHLFLNKDDMTIKSYEQHTLLNGDKIYAEVRGKEDKVVVSEKEMKNLINLSERIKDVETKSINKGSYFEHLLVRCKLDGVQQPFEDMPMAKRVEYNNSSSPVIKERMLMSFLVSEHKDKLLGLDAKQQESKQMKK